MLNKMRTDNVDVVSDSWGLCELFVPVKLTANENTALELLAVQRRVASTWPRATTARRTAARRTRVPSSWPSTTRPASRSRRQWAERTSTSVARVEKAWRGSGGGISINWPKPEYQVGNTPNVPGGFCLSGPAQCRVTPDIAMDAAPQTGYIIRSRGLGAGATPVWGLVGGTSGAAPLMAGITADANEDVGHNLGFANPFIYQEPGGVTGDFTRHHPGQQRQRHWRELHRPAPDSTW